MAEEKRVTDDSKPPSRDAFREWLVDLMADAKRRHVVLAHTLLQSILVKYDAHAAERERERKALERATELLWQVVYGSLIPEDYFGVRDDVKAFLAEHGILPPEGEG